MAILKCKMCGGDLNITADEKIIECEYCGSTQTIPDGSDEKKTNLFNRANRLRMDNEFDKAAGVYESIVAEFPEDSEGYWGLVLCSYGIEYVDDTKTGKKIPTCHRTITSSVMDNDNFIQACENADVIARGVYREEAKVIDKLQQKIIAVVENEEPYDVFICYKETDDITKQRTEDSLIAQDIYTELIKEGYKVFFSRVTLRDKAGTEYEPYIYAALRSAKIMLAIGTKYDYYDAVWVKNEWSRYISMMADDSTKHLIPCFKDLDAYDIPKEFKNLQALNMGEVTFFKNLTDNVERLIPKKTVETPIVIEASTPSAASATTDSLLKRAFMFLEDGDPKSASEYAEKVLDIDPECGDAYVVKFLVSFNMASIDDIAIINQVIVQNNEPSEALPDNITILDYKSRPLSIKAIIELTGFSLADAVNFLESLPQEFPVVPDADTEKIREKLVSVGFVLANNTEASVKKGPVIGDVLSLIDDPNFKKAEKFGKSPLAKKFVENILAVTDPQKESLYNTAVNILNSKVKFISDIDFAVKSLKELGQYKDSAAYIKKCEEEISSIREFSKLLLKFKFEEPKSFFDGYVGVTKDGNAQFEEGLAPNTAVCMVPGCVLQSNGRVRFSDYNYKTFENSWEDIVDIYGGHYHIVALSRNGKVYAAGSNSSGQCDVSEWTDVVKIFADKDFTAGLKSDGTILVTGDVFGSGYLLDKAKNYKKIFYPYYEFNLVGETATGRYEVLTPSENDSFDLSNWDNIVSANIGFDRMVGLKADGTVVACSEDSQHTCDLSDLRDIIDIYCNGNTISGLRSDGTMIGVDAESGKEQDMSDLQNIAAPIKGNTAVEIFEKRVAQCEEGAREESKKQEHLAREDFKKRAQEFQKYLEPHLVRSRQTYIDKGYDFYVGLKKDGTVVAVGNNDKGQCDVGSWTDIVAISARSDNTVGLKNDGTVVAVGNNDKGQCDVGSWTDIVAISAGTYHTVGLKKDGTVVAVGSNKSCQCNVELWTDIVAISTGTYHTVGLKKDGTVVATGNNNKGECDVGSWTDIVAISAGCVHTVGLKKDGTVVAVGSDGEGQCHVGDWKNIVAISARGSCTIGLDKNGFARARGSTQGMTAVKLVNTEWANERFAVIVEGNCPICMKLNGDVELYHYFSSYREGMSIFTDIMYPIEAETIEEFEQAREAMQEKYIKERLENEKMQKYRSAGVCQHCGGKFKGLFTKVCAECGIKKDY